jgi:hypothetical protein
MSEAKRVSFEAWANTQGDDGAEGYCLDRNTNYTDQFRYRVMRTQHAWEGFQGALAQPKGHLEWANAQAICDLPAVDEAIRGLLSDQTGDNATMLVREVLRVKPTQSKCNGTWNCPRCGSGECMDGGDSEAVELPRSAKPSLLMETILNTAISANEYSAPNLEALRAEVKHWKSNHADVVSRLAIATQRPDLPVDRIPAIKEIETLRAENARLLGENEGFRTKNDHAFQSVHQDLVIELGVQDGGSVIEAVSALQNENTRLKEQISEWIRGESK